MKNKAITLKLDEELLKEFDAFADNVGASRSGLINMFMKYCVAHRELPFRIGDKVKRTINYADLMDEPTYSIIREALSTNIKEGK